MRFALALGLLGVLTLASTPPARAEPGDDLTIFVLTFGPSSHPFFKFGHNAILVQRSDGIGLVYNFGTFDFDSVALIPKFLRGRFHYWLSVSPVEATLAGYIAENRTIEAQEIDLDAASKLELARSLRENARPENRKYLYDYFWDNCSTRVRDAIDRATGGRIRRAGRRPASQTFRAHALRMTADLLPEYLGLHLGLGSATDIPITGWDEAFLPGNMRDLLREVRIPGAVSDKPLVKSEQVVFAARRPPPPDRPPNWTPWFLAVGLGVGAALASLGRLSVRHRSARVALGVWTSLHGLLAGLLGLTLAALWAFTDHRAAHANANITLLAPWAVVLVGWGIGVARGRPASISRAYLTALSVVGFALLGLVHKFLPGPGQDNAAFVSALLPVWLGLSLGLRFLAAHHRAEAG